LAFASNRWLFRGLHTKPFYLGSFRIAGTV
jgi:hypothetical protein